jgi:CDP-glycerol glycerophosphotransferase
MIKALIRNILYTGVKCFQWAIQRICSIKKRKVVFISFGGKSYSDNPRAISEKLHEVDSDYEIVWLFKNPDSKKGVIPAYVKCVRSHSISSLYELATAGFWVDNFGKPLWTYKSNKQYYIQTWHGDRGFKKVLYDAWPDGKRPTPLFESDRASIMLAGSIFGERKISGAFKYSGELLKCGSPRNDIHFISNNSVSINIKKYFYINSESKILLFAPTFRKRTTDSENQDIHGLDLLNVLKVLEKVTQESWVCLIRAHAASSGINFSDYNSKIINATDYEDMADLLNASDLLITDYSSSAGDYVLTNKPLILYHPDYNEYISVERSLYFSVEESPYVVARTPDELIEILMKVDKIDWKNVNMKIREFYGVYESGKASESVVDWILEKSDMM